MIVLSILNDIFKNIFNCQRIFRFRNYWYPIYIINQIRKTNLAGLQFQLHLWNRLSVDFARQPFVQCSDAPYLDAVSLIYLRNHRYLVGPLFSTLLHSSSFSLLSVFRFSPLLKHTLHSRIRGPCSQFDGTWSPTRSWHVQPNEPRMIECDQLANQAG